MGTKIKSDSKVKLTVYLPSEIREKVEKFGRETVRDLSKTVQYLLETHPALNKKIEIAQIEQK